MVLVTVVSASILAAVSAEGSEASGVYVCYLKGLVSVYFTCPLRLGFSETSLYLCICNQPS